MSKKDATILVYLTQDVRDLVETLANAQGIKAAEYVRNLVIQDLDRRTIFTTQVKKELAEN